MDKLRASTERKGMVDARSLSTLRPSPLPLQLFSRSQALLGNAGGGSSASRIGSRASGVRVPKQSLGTGKRYSFLLCGSLRICGCNLFFFNRRGASVRRDPQRRKEIKELVGWAKERSDVPINVSMMGTAPDSSASTTNVPKGAFAHPTSCASTPTTLPCYEARSGFCIQRY